MLASQACSIRALKGQLTLIPLTAGPVVPNRHVRKVYNRSSRGESSLTQNVVVADDEDVQDEEPHVLEASPEPSWPVVTPSTTTLLRRSASPTPAASRGFNLRRLKWGGLKPQSLAVTMLFVLAVILVNYGVENIINYYLGEGPVGAIMCILFGAGVLAYLKLKRIPVSKLLLTGFWN